MPILQPEAPNIDEELVGPVVPPNIRTDADPAEISTGNIVSGKRHRTLVTHSLYYLYSLAICKSTVPPESFHSLRHRSDKREWKAAYSKELNNLQPIGQMEIVPTPSDVKTHKAFGTIRGQIRQHQEIPNLEGPLCGARRPRIH